MTINCQNVDVTVQSTFNVSILITTFVAYKGLCEYYKVCTFTATRYHITHVSFTTLVL